MPGYHDLASQLMAVEEKLHFLHQTITACRGTSLAGESLAGLAHIVSDLTQAMREIRRDMDALRVRMDGAPEPAQTCATTDQDDAWDDEAGERRRHGG